MAETSPLELRASGVLLHPTSFPGGRVGTLGEAAYRFVDWLGSAGQSMWQILPLVAVDEGGSPYNGLSAVAGNPLLIDLDALVQDGLLRPEETGDRDTTERVDYPAVSAWKERQLALAHRALTAGRAPRLRGELEEYRAREADWLDDYVLFRSIRGANGGKPWTEWEPELRDREPGALRAARERLTEDIERRVFEQFLFDRQWAALRAYAHGRGVHIVGDIPIFVAHDSADVWAHPELFFLDRQGRPEVVSGVPPDYFSETGQRWGNPLFRWDALRETGYRWWVERFRRTLEWVDIVRIDHFRGFQAYWEIPAREETAVNGEWREGPGAEFFRAVEDQLGPLPVIAEDLGLITDEVDALRDELGFPGMRVLQFAFDGDPRNPHLPANYPPRSVVYTGTHDNDTVVGWWEQASTSEREQARRLMGKREGELHWKLMELVFASDANLAIVPIQDVLGLGSDARMNTPGTSTANWSWRLREGALTEEMATRLGELTRRTGRLGQPQPMGRS